MHIHEIAMIAALLAITTMAQDHKPDHKTPKHTNRLSNEKSPYLLQHQHNPVDWWPWCAEAFEEARKRGVPVFVSVGYSTCHWCHVMAHESFENEALAAQMNRDYVNIKVDREERPDIDAIIQKYIQVMSRQGGGWPASVFMTHDKQPIFAGTYFPPEDMHGRPGFSNILTGITKVWKDKPDEILKTGKQINKIIADMTHTEPSKKLPDVLLALSAADSLLVQHDKAHGGFGSAPKFPRTSVHDLLLAVAGRTGRASYREAAEHSLLAMAKGGIYDHVGGGFHRYSTDPIWLVPHFEKMLYDEALIAQTYTAAWQATENDELAYVAQDTLDCVLRDFQHSTGGLMCAYDADSGGEEGSYYVWTMKELEELLDKSTVDVVFSRFSVQTNGNWNELPGTNILAVEQSWKDVADELKKTPAEVRALWEGCRAKLRAARDKKPKPGLDHKILAGWNGMAISALAKAGFAFDRDDYIAAAVKSATFIHEKLTSKEGLLLRRWCDGEALHPGVLTDYAFVSQGYIDLFEATGDKLWLDRAASLARRMNELFAAKDGGFYDAPVGDLGIQTKEPYDGAIPSGNSVAVSVLLRLSDWLMRKDLHKQATTALRAFDASMRRAPIAYPTMLMGLLAAHDGLSEIVVAAGSEPGEMSDVLRKSYHPLSIRLLASDQQLAILGQDIPLLKGKSTSEGKAVAYLCKDGVCKAPSQDANKLKASIEAALLQDPPEPEK